MLIFRVNHLSNTARLTQALIIKSNSGHSIIGYNNSDIIVI